MKLNFNNLRVNIANDFNKLIDNCNNAICTDIDYSRIIIPVHDINNLLNDLRIQIGTLLSIYDENDSTIDVIDMELHEFNPENL